MRFLPFLLLGCPKPKALPSIWEGVPTLPSPAAGAYTRSEEKPPDAAIARLVVKHRWDASLSGAAGGLAVQLSNPNGPKALTRWAVREALWRAGYPYPILDAKAWLAQPDGSPPPQLRAWLDKVSPEDDLGLVRSRGHDDDVFVAIRARPTVDLAQPIPRQVAVGGTLPLPALPGATYTIADADGHLQTGSLETPTSIEMPTQGEWLVQISTTKPIATFPVYVGIVPPSTSLIERTASVRDDTEVIARTSELMGTIRQAYGSPVPPRDFMLDAGARSLLDGGGTPADILSSIGIAPESAAVWSCDRLTVEVCLDRAVWTPTNRLALLDDSARIGLAARVDATGVHLVGILARTE